MDTPLNNGYTLYTAKNEIAEKEDILYKFPG